MQVKCYACSFSGLSCADIMSSPVVSIASGTTIATAAAMLKRHGIKALPVIDDRAFVVGIVTQADIARNMAAGKLRVLATFIDRWFASPGSVLTVSSIMTTHVSTVSATTSIAPLVPLFAPFGHHHNPALDPHREPAALIPP